MIFPIGDDNVDHKVKPWLTYFFITLCIGVFIFQLTKSVEGINAFFHRWGAIPQEITHGVHLDSLLTNIFIHANLFHLVGNLMFLWIFSDNIEAIYGKVGFAIFYVLGGIIATLTHIYFNMDGTIPLVGASGSISAVLGAYILLFPRSNIKMWALFFRFTLPAFVYLGVWFLTQIYSNMMDSGDENASGVAWFAHIGGFVFGITVTFLLLKFNVISRKSLKKVERA